MSAVAIVRRQDGIILASDGAYVLDDGRLAFVRSKIDLYPEMNCAITSRGSGLGPKYIQDLMDWSGLTLTFDQLIEGFPAIMIDTTKFVQARGDARTHNFSVFMVGWSDARERFESYVSRSYGPERAATLACETSALTAPACSLIPLPSIYLAPQPMDIIADGFGLAVPPPDAEAMTWSEACSYAALAICASRFCVGRLEETPDAEARSNVGGFVQIVGLGQDAINTQIVHRWPDVIGRTITPTVGDPSPWHSHGSNLI